VSKLLSFRLWGDYAHFKKYYTTTSPLTFEFPPPPTLLGIISAIIGLDKDEYLSYFQNPDDFLLSVCIDQPVKKVRWSQNLIDTKHHFWKIYNRTQIRMEFLKDAAFVVYFYHNDSSVYSRLKEHLEKHESIYSICFGLSELLVNFEYFGELNYKIKSSNKWIHLDSVLPVSRLLNENAIDLVTDREIFKVNYPIWMARDRVVTKREDVLFERTANPIRCVVKNFCETDKGNRIVFF